jgi:DNA-binding transcriptional LysR family regulator
VASQAAVSRSVASLERTLGLRTLQRRTTRSITPTPVGERVIVHAQRILAEVALPERAARDRNSELKIGYAWSVLVVLP